MDKKQFLCTSPLLKVALLPTPLGFFVCTLVCLSEFLLLTENSLLILFSGLTMLLCLSPEVSNLVIAILWILFPIAYLAMDDLSNRIHEKFHPTSFIEVPYIRIESNTSDELPSKLSCVEMSWLVWKTQASFLALFASNFSKQLLVNSVATTLAFTNTSLAPRNQYLFYMLALGTGDFFGRSYIGLFSLCGI